VTLKLSAGVWSGRKNSKGMEGGCQDGGVHMLDFPHGAD
jgi:hypothetical protein